MSIYSYKLTVDSGFAPNPFWGVLTLATCKPRLREKRKEGDWIAGWTSSTLCGDKVGEERLVYLMQITEKVSFADYFTDERFRSKIPDQNSLTYVNCCGDNIYRPLVSNASVCSHFNQVPNCNHGGNEKEYDLSSLQVLVSNRFVYFGREALAIPDEFRPQVPQGQAPFGHRTDCPDRCQQFIEFVFDGVDTPIVGQPHWWPSEDATWTTTSNACRGKPTIKKCTTKRKSSGRVKSTTRRMPIKC